MPRILSLVLSALLLCSSAGCSPQVPESVSQAPSSQTETAAEESPAAEGTEAAAEETPAGESAETDPAAQGEASEATPGADSGSSGREDSAQEEASGQEAPTGTVSRNGKLIVIDPGHQARANTGKEPLGPGSTEMKTKVSGGTAGVASGVPEYELTLTVSLLLRSELEARGYQVMLTRESHDVDISNRERADMANSAGADVFLRIHADGSTNPQTNGAMTICPTAGSPYPIGKLYSRCRLLADCVLDEFVASTGAYREKVWETDTMSGVNWCQVPVTLVELGYMTNPAEDAKLNDPSYQALMVKGIANGVDRYFAEVGE